MRTSWSGSLRAFVLGTRASAGIELAIGAVVLLGVAAACFDLYSRVEADTTSARLAATMADYVSRGPNAADGKLDGDALKALGKFLHEHELDAPAHLVFVITAFEQQGGNPKFHWLDDTLRFGDTTVTTELAGKCPQYVEENGGAKTAKNLSGFRMAVDEVLIIVEVCARLTREGSLTGRFVAGDIYRLHALPLRTPGKSLPEPTYARLDTRTSIATASTRPTVFAVIPAKAGIHRLSPSALVRVPDASSADIPADVPPTARAQA